VIHKDGTSCKFTLGGHDGTFTDKGVSDIAMLSGFVIVNIIASIIQQIHTMVWWNDAKQAQHKDLVDHVGNPEVAITGGSAGIDLALFHIQYYTYNVDALIVLFW
jgi:hypothetical protein